MSVFLFTSHVHSPKTFHVKRAEEQIKATSFGDRGEFLFYFKYIKIVHRLPNMVKMG